MCHVVSTHRQARQMSDADVDAIQQYERDLLELSFEDVDCDSSSDEEDGQRSARSDTADFSIKLSMNASSAALLNRRLKSRSQSDTQLDLLTGESSGSSRAFNSMLLEVIAEHLLLGDVRRASEYVAQNPDTVMSGAEADHLLFRFLKTFYDVPNPLEVLVFMVDVLRADINARNKHGLCALHVLCDNSILGTFLLTRGADLLVRDTQGVTVLEYCLRASGGTGAWVLEALQQHCAKEGVTLQEYLGNDETRLQEFQAVVEKYNKGGQHSGW